MFSWMKRKVQVAAAESATTDFDRMLTVLRAETNDELGTVLGFADGWGRDADTPTIVDHHELGAMFGLDDVELIAAELRRRGIRYHLSAGGIYVNAAHMLATFD
jgi:hypothetical protein